MKLKFLSIVAVCCTVYFSSCKESNDFTPQTLEITKEDNLPSFQVKVENNTLEFANDSVFISFWTSFLKGDSATIMRFSELKKNTNFYSLNDKYKSFLAEYDNVSTPEESNSIIAKYSDIIKVEKDTSISLKFGMHSMLDFFNSSGIFIVDGKQKKWSELASDRQLKNKSTTQGGILPSGIFHKWETEGTKDFFQTTTYTRKIELVHDIYYPGIPLQAQHTIYMTLEEYKRKYSWSARVWYPANFKGWRINWSVTDPKDWYNENGEPQSLTISGAIPYFEENNTMKAYRYFVINEPADYLINFNLQLDHIESSNVGFGYYFYY